MNKMAVQALNLSCLLILLSDKLGLEKVYNETVSVLLREHYPKEAEELISVFPEATAKPYKEIFKQTLH